MNRLPDWRTGAPAGVSLAQAMVSHSPIEAAMPPADSLPAMGRGLQRILTPEAQRRWRGTLLAWYTPQRVEYILRAAMTGDLITQWELFHMMEQTWPKLAECLQKLKRSVAALDWHVESWSEQEEEADKEADERCALVNHCLRKMRPDPTQAERGFSGMVFDVLDAWAKGISVNELLWEPRDTSDLGQIIAPKATAWVHPDNYALGGDGELGLRINPVQNMGNIAMPTLPMSVEPFPPYKFLIATNQASTFHFSATAMLRPLCWWWVAFNFGAEYLVNYAQLFGIPVRLGQYPKGATPAEVENVVSMLSNMGSAAWAAFPEGTQFQLLDSSKGTGQMPQAEILDRADKYCELLFMGQTLTSDVKDSGSRALGDVHMSVKDEIVQTAADWVCEVLNTQLVPAILELNYGDSDKAPRIEAKQRKEEDKLQEAQRDQILLQNVPMPKAWFYERHGIPLPSDGEETIGGAQMGSQIPGKPMHPEPDADDKGGPSDDDEDNAGDAEASAQEDPAGRAERRIRRIVEKAVAESVGARVRWLEPLRNELDGLIELAATNSVSDAELVKFAERCAKRLPLLFHKMDHRALAKSLEAAQATAMRAGLLDASKQKAVA